MQQVQQQHCGYYACTIGTFRHTKHDSLELQEMFSHQMVARRGILQDV